jgi:hypothetical protein
MTNPFATALALHRLLTVCTGCYLCRPCETYVNLGFGSRVKQLEASEPGLDYMSMPPLTPQI